MAKIIGLPKLSPTMEEGTLVKWVKQEGEEVGVDDLLAEVETDKATMEFRSFDRGVLLKILVPEGETLAPDTPVAIIGNKGEDVSKLVESAKGGGGGKTAEAKEAKPSEPKKEKEEVRASTPPTARENGTEVEQAEAKDQTKQPADKKQSSAERPSAAPRGGNGHGRVLASPLVRRIAREHDLDLAEVEGSGPGGRVIKRDVEAHLNAAPETRAARTALSESQEPRIVKVSQMRKAIARRLVESKQQVPHFYLTIDVDAEPIWQARIAINTQLEKSGEKVSINDILIKAAAVCLRRVPEVNASFRGDTIHFHQRVDISVAVAVPDGLLTPVVRSADRKGVLEIAHEVRDLAQRANEKKLKPEEMSDGTFSISNLGMYGIEDFAAVINPPEGAILAVGAVREEPVIKNGAVVPGRRLRMTLSCDHRVVDGAVGAKWLAAFKQLLENPIGMLL